MLCSYKRTLIYSIGKDNELVFTPLTTNSRLPNWSLACKKTVEFENSELSPLPCVVAPLKPQEREMQLARIYVRYQSFLNGIPVDNIGVFTSCFRTVLDLRWKQGVFYELLRCWFTALRSENFLRYPQFFRRCMEK